MTVPWDEERTAEALQWLEECRARVACVPETESILYSIDSEELCDFLAFWGFRVGPIEYGMRFVIHPDHPDLALTVQTVERVSYTVTVRLAVELVDTLRSRYSP